MKAVLATILIAAVFLVPRISGISLPYHQDEWKNVSTSETMEGAGAFFAHPPLMQMIFVAADNVFGHEYFRVLPLLFGVAAAILLYFVARKRGGRPVAIWAVVLFSVCFYNIFGSLQPDVDGAILPFFFLLAVFAYDRINEDMVLNGDASTKRNFLILLLMSSVLAGLLIKLSFVLVVAAIFIDHLCEHRQKNPPRVLGSALGVSVALAAIYIGLLYLIEAVYPSFSISFMLGHANQYASNGGRGWMQIAVQTLKAIYYLSPLLTLPLLWLSKETFKRTRIFVLYIIFGSVFYLAVFDFSQGALDKYLMFVIVPLCIIVGDILASVFSRKPYNKYVIGILAVAISVGLTMLNLLPQIVVGLHPKTEWFSNVLHGNWNILTPFTGGSGPIGFYVSFLFIAASFIVVSVVAVAGKLRPDWRASAAILIVIIGLAYNGIFAEELLYGRINGSAPAVLHDLTAYIRSSSDIKEVITYNDIGARELGPKYAGRFYAAPQFEEVHRQKFAKFNGYYMIVDIPHLYETGFYSQFFKRCHDDHSAQSSKIAGHVYRCPVLEEVLP